MNQTSTMTPQERSMRVLDFLRGRFQRWRDGDGEALVRHSEIAAFLDVSPTGQEGKQDYYDAISAARKQLLQEDIALKTNPTTQLGEGGYLFMVSSEHWKRNDTKFQQSLAHVQEEFSWWKTLFRRVDRARVDIPVLEMKLADLKRARAEAEDAPSETRKQYSALLQELVHAHRESDTRMSAPVERLCRRVFDKDLPTIIESVFDQLSALKDIHVGDEQVRSRDARIKQLKAEQQAQLKAFRAESTKRAASLTQKVKAREERIANLAEENRALKAKLRETRSGRPQPAPPST